MIYGFSPWFCLDNWGFGGVKNINLLQLEQRSAFLSWNSNFVKTFFQTHIWMKLKDSYLISNIRLDLIQRWCKQCSRHYKLTKPHKNKRLKRVIIPCNNEPAENTYFWVEIHASEARVTVSRRASKHTKRTGLLRCLWREDETTMLGLLARIERCLSGLPYFRETLLSKDAWYSKWDMNLSISFKRFSIVEHSKNELWWVVYNQILEFWNFLVGQQMLPKCCLDVTNFFKIIMGCIQ